jgi:hypothetical protein
MAALVAVEVNPATTIPSSAAHHPLDDPRGLPPAPSQAGRALTDRWRPRRLFASAARRRSPDEAANPHRAQLEDVETMSGNTEEPD